jgi:xanthine dehydrogenase small subunit
MIEFLLNNKHIKTDQNSSMTLLDFVRYEQQLPGTKIGCREGDCGACTVLIGELNNIDNVEYQSITSCISPLGNAHGKHVVSIEGLNLKNELTVAQQSMHNHYATQCGFCTPGFVVSLSGFAMSDKEKNQKNTLDAVSGNICRCTGYKSIERAANEFSEKLVFTDSSRSLDWLIEHDFLPKYFSDIAKRLIALNTNPIVHSGTNFVFGGTDLYVHKADELFESNVNLIQNQKDLKGIQIHEDSCYIGAGTTVSDLLNNDGFNALFPNLKAHLKLVSSEQIRNMASLGGNFVNASPIGDMTIFFMALNSDLTLIGQNGSERIIPLRSFFSGYKTYDLSDGELIKSISFKTPDQNSKFNFEKVSKRTHLDIASVNTAISIKVINNSIEEAHVAIGGVAAIPKYLKKTSDFLIGKSPNNTTIVKAQLILQDEISPISDVRGSSEYKRLLARQLFFAHFIELFKSEINLDELVADE